VGQVINIDPIHDELLPHTTSALHHSVAQDSGFSSSYSTALAQRDVAKAQRDAALAQRDVAKAQRDVILRTTIWKLFFRQ
jgi:hypothetical protein